MDLLIHQILSGLATGGIYASVALALVMIYQATHLVNFAQGEMAMFSTYIAWSLINAGMPYWAAFFSTIVIAFAAGVVIERVIVRPVENSSILAVVIVFIGLLVILNSLAGWIYSYTIKSFPSPFPAQPLFGNSYVSSHELGSFAITLVVRDLFDILRTINANEKVSMLLVEQNASLALDLADHAYLLETGRVVVSGTADAIRDNESVRRSYLGY